MTFGLVLTIIFLVLRYVLHVTDWSLLTCFLPVIIELGIEVLVFLVALIGIALGVISRPRGRSRSGGRR